MVTYGLIKHIDDDSHIYLTDLEFRMLKCLSTRHKEFKPKVPFDGGKDTEQDKPNEDVDAAKETGKNTITVADIEKAPKKDNQIAEDDPDREDKKHVYIGLEYLKEKVNLIQTKADYNKYYLDIDEN